MQAHDSHSSAVKRRYGSALCRSSCHVSLTAAFLLVKCEGTARRRNQSMVLDSGECFIYIISDKELVFVQTFNVLQTSRKPGRHHAISSTSETALRLANAPGNTQTCLPHLVEFKSCLSKLIRSSRAANNFGLSFKMLLAAMENDGNIEILLIEHDGG